MPSLHLQVEFPIALIDRNLDKQPPEARTAAEAFIHYCFTPEAQREFAACGFRCPSCPSSSQQCHLRLLQCPTLLGFYSIVDWRLTILNLAPMLDSWSILNCERPGTGPSYEMWQRSRRCRQSSPPGQWRRSSGAGTPRRPSSSRCLLLDGGRHVATCKHACLVQVLSAARQDRTGP